MATSGTFNFAPSLGQIILDAYGRIGLQETELQTAHIGFAQREANYWLSSISNRGPNLWAVDLQTLSLVRGTPTYDVPAETVMILDLYVDTFDDDGNPTSRTLSPLSRSDYANISNKLQEGQPTSFWFDRLIAPTLSLWPSPDDNGPYTLRYYRYRQVMDANLAAGQNPELPYLFLDAFVAALAHRVARKYKPELVAALKADADEAWKIASDQNTEWAPMDVTPMLGGYFR